MCCTKQYLNVASHFSRYFEDLALAPARKDFNTAWCLTYIWNGLMGPPTVSSHRTCSTRNDASDFFPLSTPTPQDLFCGTRMQAWSLGWLQFAEACLHACLSSRRERACLLTCWASWLASLACCVHEQQEHAKSFAVCIVEQAE